MSWQGAAHLAELLNKFPVGNDPHFPSIHVYMEPQRPNDLTFTPWSWELNGLNLKVWGNAVVCQHYC